MTPPLPTLSQLITTGDTFVLLDDARDGGSRLFHGWQRSVVCHDPTTLQHWQTSVAQALADGTHIALLADYEWGLPLQHLPASPQETPPALCAEIFAHCHHMDRSTVADWLADADISNACGLFGWQAPQGRAHFDAAIAAIHRAITRGETYQVNHTFALEGLAHGQPAALYALLRQRQPAPYGALIHHPDKHWTLSLSPELFVRCADGIATAAPMKGTAAAGDDPQTAAQWLRNDPKNQAENLMIVDLLRNDLARIATPGGVSVPSLFDVQHTGRVLGMTSTVKARMDPTTDLAALLRAVFPCGSITGAPKRSTMSLIEHLETQGPHPHRRGLYTGAIGWLAGGVNAQDLRLCLSVPIRTLELQPRPDGLLTARLPVGAGITIDSDPAIEWAECQLKAGFATQATAGFTLFETLRIEADGRAPLWSQHRARLLHSARTLGFPCDPDQLDATIAQLTQMLAPGQRWRVRLTLDALGALQAQHEPLTALPDAGRVTVRLSSSRVSTPAPLLAHKTSLRHGYDQALREAIALGDFDVLFFNDNGHLTEGARSNVFVQLDGHWYTPPVTAGLLPGVMRAQLLADPALDARERLLTRADLERAQDLLVCNALRGALPARWVH